MSPTAMGERGKTPVSRRQSTTPVSRSYQAASLSPVNYSESSDTQCMALIHFHVPSPVESIFTPLLFVHGVRGHTDPTLPHNAPPLPTSAITPFPESCSTSPDHLPPITGCISPLVIHRVTLTPLSNRRGKCSAARRLS